MPWLVLQDPSFLASFNCMRHHRLSLAPPAGGWGGEGGSNHCCFRLDPVQRGPMTMIATSTLIRAVMLREM